MLVCRCLRIDSLDMEGIDCVLGVCRYAANIVGSTLDASVCDIVNIHACCNGRNRYLDSKWRRFHDQATPHGLNQVDRFSRGVEFLVVHVLQFRILLAESTLELAIVLLKERT